MGRETVRPLTQRGGLFVAPATFYGLRDVLNRNGPTQLTIQRPIVETNSLTKHYGRLPALEDCTLSVGRGQVFGLLGPNGSGKSNFIEILSQTFKRILFRHWIFNENILEENKTRPAPSDTLHQVLTLEPSPPQADIDSQGIHAQDLEKSKSYWS